MTQVAAERDSAGAKIRKPALNEAGRLANAYDRYLAAVADMAVAVPDEQVGDLVTINGPVI